MPGICSAHHSGFFYHLSCVPKKGDPKKGTRREFFTGMLGRPRTFRKQPAFVYGRVFARAGYALHGLYSRSALISTGHRLINAGRRLANLRASDIRNTLPSDSVACLKFSYEVRLAIFSEMVRQ
jgi:hypothetical protein